PHPALEQLAERIDVSAIAGQPISLRERDELEMPVELPQVLDVADEAGIAMVESLAVGKRRGRSRQRIGTPLRRKAEREASPEEREHPPTNVVGNGEIRLGIELDGGLRNALDAAARRPLGGRGVATPDEPEALRAEAQLPPRASGDLLGRHRSRTIQIPLQTLHGPVLWNSPFCVPTGRDQAHSVPQEWPTTCSGRRGSWGDPTAAPRATNGDSSVESIEEPGKARSNVPFDDWRLASRSRARPRNELERGSDRK